MGGETWTCFKLTKKGITDDSLSIFHIENPQNILYYSRKLYGFEGLTLLYFFITGTKK